MQHHHVDPSTLNLDRTIEDLGPAVKRLPLLVGIVGLVGAVVAAFVRSAMVEGEWALERFMFSYLHNYLFFFSLAVGALFFVLVHHLSRAGWSVTVRRLTEVMAAALFPGLALLFLPILACVWYASFAGGEGLVFPWTDTAYLAENSVVAMKTAYLNPTFFTIRAVIYFAIWGFLAKSFLNGSVRQDTNGAPEISQRSEVRSAWGVLVTFLTVTFAAIDWAMSLAPMWFSTMFGVYFIAGAAVSMFAMLWVIIYFCQSRDVLVGAVTVEHQHDIGKYLHGFIIFWAYITFCQFLLIWYADIPEETHWFLKRQENGWQWIGILLIVGHFIIPFLGVMSRHVKRNRKALLFWSVWILVMHWFDLYYIVMPEGAPGALPFGAIDVLAFLGIGGLTIASVVRAASGHALVPKRDPRLVESLAFHNV